jgi:hypothetical protein
MASAKTQPNLNKTVDKYGKISIIISLQHITITNFLLLLTWCVGLGITSFTYHVPRSTNIIAALKCVPCTGLAHKGATRSGVLNIKVG